MSILTKEEILAIIKKIDGDEQYIQPALKQLSIAIQSAVLEKLAGMELPEPYQRETYATSANTESVRKGFEMGGYVKTPNLWDEDQLRQAYAQGAASQFSAEPGAWMVTAEMQDGTERTYSLTGRYKDVRDACDFGEPVPLYTLKTIE